MALVPQIDNWQLVKIHWKAQALSNVFFGLTMVLIFLFYERWSNNAILATTLLYLAIYGIIFVPYFGLVPLVLVRPAKKVLAMLAKGRTPAETDLSQALSILVNLPRKLAFIIFFSVVAGFAIGVFILAQGIVPEFMPHISTVIFSGMSIGLVVAVMHAFFNYIMVENYVQPFNEYLVGRFPKLPFKVRRVPLPEKIFVLVLFSVLASQIIIADLFIVHIALREPGELWRTLIFVGLVLGITLVYVFTIVTFFSRNLIRPLQRIIAWAQAMLKAEGVSKLPLNLVADDEIADVIAYTRRLVQNLEESKAILEIRVHARTKALQELAASLEQKVAVRTGQLEQRLRELERFHRLAVGREIKMIELKKELANLKEKLAKAQPSIS